MLKIENLEVAYGNIKAIKGISLEVNKGEIVTLIGSNGAGKSTTLRAISGILKARAGRIIFENEEIQGKEGHEIVKMGICQSPEGRRIFPRMSVDENLDLGAFLRTDKAGIAADRERVLDLFPRLKERINQKSGTMSGGEQQMLAVGRALMGSPKLLLMDEVTGGVDQRTIPGLVELVLKLKKNGITVVTIEHNMKIIMDISDRILALNQGKRIAFDIPKNISQNSQVIDAYLGTIDAS